MRAGAYLQRDVVIGLITIVILLEAARRALGMALSIIAICFLLYDYFGQYMPDLIAHKGASLTKLSSQMYLTTEGIFGVPLGVSAGFVFLFVLFGALLERAGAGDYFINMAYAALGKYRGGPAKASVAASGLTGIISGSSIANTVTTGTFTIPLMKRLGFPAHKAAAVEVAASTNGQLMPPIMGAAAFIIAEFLGLAYTDVVMAAFSSCFSHFSSSKSDISFGFLISSLFLASFFFCFDSFFFLSFLFWFFFLSDSFFSESFFLFFESSL